MSMEQNKINMRRAIEEFWNKGDYAVMDELAVPNLVTHPLPPAYKNDLAGYKKYAKETRTAFPDLHFVIEDLIAEGDNVVCWL